MDILHRKAIKLISLGLVLAPLCVYANKPSLSPLQQLEELSHTNKGCPENSECDAEMGQLLDQWKRLAERWLSTDKGRALYPKELALVTNKRGWPSEFYARPTIAATLAPVLNTSSCPQHRSKDPTETLLRARAFLKGTHDGHAIFTKGAAEFRLKLGEAIFLQQVVWHHLDKSQKTFYVPLGEKPIYVEGENLVALVESEDLYALLTTTPQGQWTFAAAPESGISQYHDGLEEIPCPKEAVAIPTGFSKTYCQKITQRDGTAAGVVQLFWACQ